MTTGTFGLLGLITIAFLCGFGWGQWHAERSIRKEKALMEVNKLFLSMPLNAEDASNALGLLKQLIDQVEADKKLCG